MAAAMAAALDTTAMAYAENLGEIDAADQGCMNIAICIIGTLV